MVMMEYFSLTFTVHATAIVLLSLEVYTLKDIHNWGWKRIKCHISFDKIILFSTLLINIYIVIVIIIL